MRQKLITLCPNSFEIAQKKPNFSAWVRKKLLEDVENNDGVKYLHHYQCPLCRVYVMDEERYARKCEKCIYPMDFQGRVAQ